MSNCCKYYKQKKQVSYNSGTTWEDVVPAEYQKGELLSTSRYDAECGCASDCGEHWKDIELYNGEAAGDCCGSATNGVHLQRGWINEGVSHTMPYYIFLGNCCNYLDDYALEELPHLDRVKLDENIQSIGNYAFIDSSNLKEVYITRTTPPTIGTDIFRNVSNVKVYVPDNAVNTYKSAWSNYANIIFPASDKSRKANITDSNGYEYITPYDGCPIFGNELYNFQVPMSSITSINIGDSVVSIITYESFENLTSLTISQSVEYIVGISSYSLSSVTLPSSIVYIKGFTYCWNLQSVTIEATTPPELDSNSFNHSNNAVFYVPSQSVNAYKAAPVWSNFASRIQAIP